MNLHDGYQGRIEIVGLWLLRVKNLDWVCSTRDREDRASEEVRRELLGVESGRSHNQLEIWPPLHSLCR